MEVAENEERNGIRGDWSTLSAKVGLHMGYLGLVLLDPSGVCRALRECIGFLSTVPRSPNWVTLEQTHDVGVVLVVGGKAVIETSRLSRRRQ